VRLKYLLNKSQAMKLCVYGCGPAGSAGDLAAFTMHGERELELKDVMEAPGFTIFDPLSKDGADVAGLVMVRQLPL